MTIVIDYSTPIVLNLKTLGKQLVALIHTDQYSSNSSSIRLPLHTDHPDLKQIRGQEFLCASICRSGHGPVHRVFKQCCL